MGKIYLLYLSISNSWEQIGEMRTLCFEDQIEGIKEEWKKDFESGCQHHLTITPFKLEGGRFVELKEEETTEELSLEAIINEDEEDDWKHDIGSHWLE